MKTLVTIILVVIFPLLAMTQAYNFMSIKLKTLDEKTVDPVEIFQDNNLTVVYFFNVNCRNIKDQFDYLENLAAENREIKLKIIAVCNASNSSFGQVRSFICGNDIGIETYIDMNGELQRAMGLPVNSSLILIRYANVLSGNYTASVSYSTEQANIELSQLIYTDNHSSYIDPHHADNVIAK